MLQILRVQELIELQRPIRVNFSKISCEGDEFLLISYNAPYISGNEIDYINEVLASRNLSGNGPFTRKCQDWLEKELRCSKAFLTTSCTASLEMAAMLAGIQPGDEVIMPSYTYVSTANAFVLRGGIPVFIDIRPDTMNLDEKLIEAALTGRTKAIVPIHYSGVACNMDEIMDIAGRYGLHVIEDAAHAIGCSYKGKPLGSFGNLAAFSFHETKNIASGEGGAIIVNDPDLVDRAEIVWHKGTNRGSFNRGEIDKYSWVDIGSSYQPGELSAAFLFAQIEKIEAANSKLLKVWSLYFGGLQPLVEKGYIELPIVPVDCSHNAHLFYIKTADQYVRAELIRHLNKCNINSVFHYVPLHSSKGGRKYGRFHGTDLYTTRESERLLRLPIHYSISRQEVHNVISKIHDFFLSNSSMPAR